MKSVNPGILAILLVALSVISSCKKDGANNSVAVTHPVKSTLQIVTTGGQTDSTTSTYTYDNQSRLLTLISVSKIGGTISYDTTINSYGTNTVTQYRSYNHGTITYNLNNMGFRVSDNNAGGDTWIYNSAGYLTQTQTELGTEVDYTYNAQNQLATQVTKIVSPMTDTTTVTFVYPASPVGIAGSDWTSGKTTGALFTTQYSTTGHYTDTVNATYVAGSRNEPVQSTLISTANPSSPTVTYYYYY